MKTYLARFPGASRVETSVTVVFPGGEGTGEAKVLAEEKPKPRGKRWLRLLTNGRPEDALPGKPGEPIGLTTLLSAKNK